MNLEQAMAELRKGNAITHDKYIHKAEDGSASFSSYIKKEATLFGQDSLVIYFKGGAVQNWQISQFPIEDQFGDGFHAIDSKGKLKTKA